MNCSRFRTLSPRPMSGWKTTILADIARRITKAGYATDTAGWQAEKARELKNRPDRYSPPLIKGYRPQRAGAYEDV